MDIETYRKIAARGELLDAEELQAWMREAAVEAQRVTAQINGGFHTPDELRALVAELTGSERSTRPRRRGDTRSHTAFSQKMQSTMSGILRRRPARAAAFAVCARKKGGKRSGGSLPI